jgi:transaldolase
MKPTRALHELGQSLWLDNITRRMLDEGRIKRYVEDYSVTGLTSNPSIFDHAIASGDYDESIDELVVKGRSSEEIFFDLAIVDLIRAADIFRGVHDQTAGVDGWVSLEVSPLLARDADGTIEAATTLHARANRENLYIKIPGTTEGLVAIEECIAAGVPVNVTLLFDADDYRAAADASMRGNERRIVAGLDPRVASVASIFVSRWDVASSSLVPEELHNRLGIAVARDVYRAYREVMASDRMLRLLNAGARVQRLLWASTKTKDPSASDTLYVRALASPFTINTMPDETLEAFFDHGDLGAVLAPDGGDCDAELQRFAVAGIDRRALARQLQDEGAASFTAAWHALLARIDARRTNPPSAKKV